MKQKFTISSFFLLLSVNALGQAISSTGSLKVPRWLHESQVLDNGQVLAFGGDNGNFLNYMGYQSAELYNSGSWTFTGSMKKVRTSFASGKLDDGTVIAIGGEDGNLNKTASCEIYNVTTGIWSFADSMSFARYGHKAVKLKNGDLMVVGGLPTNKICEIYNKLTGKWSKTGDLNFARNSGLSLAVMANGNVLATGGTDGDRTAEIYDLGTKKWVNVNSPMVESRRSHSSVVLNNGNVLLIGGVFSNTCEIFDTTSKVFVSTGSMSETRATSPCIKMDNGTVLVFGLGNFFSPFDTKCIEIYDPSTGKWSTTKYNLVGTQGYTIHRISTGKILIVGGSRTTGNGAASTSYLVTQPLTSIFDYNLPGELIVYPNPAKEDLNIEIPLNVSQSYLFQLMDVYGREVFNTNLVRGKNHLPLPDISQGIYQYIIINNNNNKFLSSGKVVVE